MNDLKNTVFLDDAFDCYQLGKRKISPIPLYCYDLNKNKFVKIKSELKENCIPFINSYDICCCLIDKYLDEPNVKQYKEDCIKSIKNGLHKNKVVDFLWFFEHIDGCYGFEKFEIARVTEILKKWCESNELSYLEAEIYINKI